MDDIRDIATYYNLEAENESYNRLEGAKRKLWLDLMDEISSEPSILGASRHLLYVGRKPIEDRGLRIED